MSETAPPPGKFMVDTYLEWSKREGVPVHEDFGFDLKTLDVRPWARFGVPGAIAHVKGRGDFMTIFVLEIPPGGKTDTSRTARVGHPSAACGARGASAATAKRPAINVFEKLRDMAFSRMTRTNQLDISAP